MILMQIFKLITMSMERQFEFPSFLISFSLSLGLGHIILHLFNHLKFSCKKWTSIYPLSDN